MSFPPFPGSPEQPQHYGGQSQSGPQPGGYPGTPPGTSAWGQPGQYPAGTFDGGQPGYPGYPGPQKSKTGLIVGLSVLGVLLVGGIVTLILILTDKEDAAPVAAAPTASSASDAPASSVKKPSGLSTSSPGLPPVQGSPGQGSPGSTGGQVSADSLVKDFVNKLNAKDSPGATALVCKFGSFSNPDLEKSAANVPIVLEKGSNITPPPLKEYEEVPSLVYGVTEMTMEGKKRGLLILALDGAKAGLASCIVGVEIEPV